MRVRRTCLATAVVSGLLLSSAMTAIAAPHSATGPRAEDSAAPRRCGAIKGISFRGTFRIGLLARGRVSCQLARYVATRYERRADGGKGCSQSGGNTCSKKIGSFVCRTPTVGSQPEVLNCFSAKRQARIRGYGKF